jgi:predicted nucleic acid-binding protein
MNVFVDTSYFIARQSKRDQWHSKAMKAVRRGLRYITSALVVNETISLLQARGTFPPPSCSRERCDRVRACKSCT